MSLKLGTQDIAGISQNKICNAHFLLEPIWSDHIINDISLLRADTFSWQSGDVYTSSYNHLVQDIQGITSETETIGSYTVTFYRATDGHKICLADQEQTVLDIYNSYGIAWYYILDTTNTQFKLPRTKYGFEGLRNNVGDIIAESLPNITGSIGFHQNMCYGASGALYPSNNNGYVVTGSQISTTAYERANLDASLSSSAYQNNAPVQERATQMYLYFYVGDYSQTAIEQTAGLNSELFNGKADIDLSNCTKPHIVETYVNGTSWYRVYSDGWCEQGGVTIISSSTNSHIVYLLKEYSNTNYQVYTKYKPNTAITGTDINDSQTVNRWLGTVYSYSADSFTMMGTSHNGGQIIWETKGYIN